MSNVVGVIEEKEGEGGEKKGGINRVERRWVEMGGGEESKKSGGGGRRKEEEQEGDTSRGKGRGRRE